MLPLSKLSLSVSKPDFLHFECSFLLFCVDEIISVPNQYLAYGFTLNFLISGTALIAPINLFKKFEYAVFQQVYFK